MWVPSILDLARVVRFDKWKAGIRQREVLKLATVREYMRQK